MKHLFAVHALPLLALLLLIAPLAAHALPGLAVFPNPVADCLIVELPIPAPATMDLRNRVGRQLVVPAALGAVRQVWPLASLASEL